MEDWDAFEALLDHCYKAKLMSDPKEHPVLFGEPAFNTNAHRSVSSLFPALWMRSPGLMSGFCFCARVYENREKLTEILFEKFQVPAFFVAKNPALNVYVSLLPPKPARRLFGILFVCLCVYVCLVCLRFTVRCARGWGGGRLQLLGGQVHRSRAGHRWRGHLCHAGARRLRSEEGYDAGARVARVVGGARD